MAGGWTRDGAVQEQIDDTVKDAILRARALTPQGESAEECDDCGEPIPKKRREALPGVVVSLSSEILREQREYERSATTVVPSATAAVTRGDAVSNESSTPMRLTPSHSP